MLYLLQIHLTMKILINSKQRNKVKPGEMGVMELRCFFIHYYGRK